MTLLMMLNASLDVKAPGDFVNAANKQSNVLLGTSAMALAGILRILAQIAIFPILGRLVGPEAYGSIALVSPFVFFAMMLSESGLGACIVRAHDLSEELKNTVFTFSFVFSTLVIVIFSIVATPVGHLLKDPVFPGLLIAMSTILWFSALNIVPAALLMRSNRFQIIALSDVASSVGGITAVCIGIYCGWGVWSLVAQQIVFWLCKIAVVIIASKFRPKFQFVYDELKRHINFGSNVLAAGILSFIAKNIDNVLIGAFVGTQILGYYALAFQVVGVPQMIFGASVYFTLFSKVSQNFREGDFSADYFFHILRIVLLLCVPAIIGLAVTANVLTPILLGEKWLPAVKLIIILCPMGIAQTVSATTAAVLLGQGKANLSLRYSVISSVVTILGIMGTAWTKNSALIAISVAVTSFLYAILSIRFIIRNGEPRVGIIWQSISAPLIGSTVMGLTVYFLQQHFLSNLSALACLISSVMIGIVVYSVTLVILFRKQTKSDFLEILNAIKARGRSKVTDIA